MTSIAAVILAGGRSRRFGSTKAQARYKGRPLIQHVAERVRPQVTHLAVAGASHDLDVASIDDGVYEGMGPLAGILAGLHWAVSVQATHLLCAPCDVPLIPKNLVDILAGGLEAHAKGNAPIAIRVNGRSENACALWPVSRAADIEHLLMAEDVRALHKVLKRLDVRWIDENATTLDGSFFNVNSEHDLQILNDAADADIILRRQ